MLGWSYLGLQVGLEVIGNDCGDGPITERLLDCDWMVLHRGASGNDAPAVACERTAVARYDCRTMAPAAWRRNERRKRAAAAAQRSWRSAAAAARATGDRDLRAPARGASRGEAPAVGCERPTIAFSRRPRGDTGRLERRRDVRHGSEAPAPAGPLVPQRRLQRPR